MSNQWFTAMEFHPLSQMFPLLEGEDFESFKEDIREHGLHEPICMFEGMILDGRNRYRACQATGVEPVFIEFTETDPIAHVLSLNLQRRHLTESQKGLIAARFTNTVTGMNKHSVKPGGVPLTSIQDAALKVGVHRATVRDARSILAKGTEEEVAGVEAGELAVSSVAKHIRMGLSPEERKEVRGTLARDRGNRPQQFKNQQINAQLWSMLKDVIDKLTSFPNPSDMVMVVKSFDRLNLVDNKLPQALNWLQEFSNARNGVTHDQI